LPAKEGIKGASGDRNAESVVEECPKEVLFDHAEGSPAEANRRHQGAEVTAHENDASASDGDPRTRAHCHAHLGCSQRRRIVDAVSGKHHRSSVLAKAVHDGPFVSGKAFGMVFVNAKAL